MTYKAIQTIAVTGTPTSVDFTNLPQNLFQNFVIRGMARGSRTITNNNDELWIRINGLTSANYSGAELRAAGTGRSYGTYSANTYWLVQNALNASSATANKFSPVELWIGSWDNTKRPQMWSQTGITNNSSSIYLEWGTHTYSGTGFNMQSISILAPSGATFVAGTTFTIYGVGTI